MDGKTAVEVVVQHFHKYISLFKWIISSIGKVWKFEKFSATQILREINFEECRSLKKCQFCNFSLEPPNVLKMADFALIHFPKLISRKIQVLENFKKFPHLA